jgi:magnesium transporter
VVNKHNKLIGIITLADIFEVTDKNAEESLMHMGGVREDDVYLNVIEVVKSRFPWLLVSLIATTLCSLVVNYYHDTIQQAVILSAIMPIIANISGNAGTQTMTVTVLSISSKEITALNIYRVIRNQIISCSCNGLVLAILGGIILMLLHRDANLSYVFGLAVVINFALAGFLGAVIPIILDKFGFDPAVSSSVFVTTLTDVLSFAIFLGLASQLLI